jgi:hypothetical protein
VTPEPPPGGVYGEAAMSARACLPLAPVPAAGRLEAGFLIGSAGIRVTCHLSGHFVGEFAQVSDRAVGAERQAPQLLEHFPVGRHFPFF